MQSGQPDVAVKLCKVVKPVPLVLRANTVPSFALPPAPVVPYRVLPDKIKSPLGPHPSLFVPSEGSVAMNVCRVVKVCALSADVSRNVAAQTRLMRAARDNAVGQASRLSLTCL